MGQAPGSKKLNARRKAKGDEDGRRYVRMRIRGWSNADIARHCGVAESCVSQRITKHLARPVEGAEQLREIEISKLDDREKRVRKAIVENVEDTEALARLDRRLQEIAERRAKLLGLDIPVKTDPDLIVSTSAATAAATAAAVTEARAAVPAVQIILSTEATKD